MANGFERCRREDLLERGEEHRVVHVHGGGRDAEACQESGEVELRGEEPQLFHRVAVRSPIDVARLDGGQRRCGERRLEGEDRRRSLLWSSHAQVAQLGRDVGGVCGPQFHRGFVITEVVVAFRQAQPTLAQVEEVRGAVLEVGGDIGPEERPDGRRVEIHEQRHDVVG